ncbi:mechanosensitive ion channel family protein [Jiulongibacter sediminis]|uniref:mechanosensitive ion channel family protein n=1 Tax=Jiulongibacter sediminis TaxID=1605367 RepID=UPI0026EFD297|nr:mechanosensitive ion channel domain-containing protein [Jiulongibacter sediminis]
MKKYTGIIVSFLLLIIVLFLSFTDNAITQNIPDQLLLSTTVKKILVIIISSWLALEVISLAKRNLLKHYDLDDEDNLKSRKVHTQIKLLGKVVNFVIVLAAVGLVALNIPSLRKVGVGIFTSVGVAGILIGLSAQKIVGALLAGIQIAITQPFRLEDAVVVENEWGWIEEINLTFIVVRLWDKRRLVLPTTYFLEKPFQNWTRTTADIIGSVFLVTDYNVPLQELRKELTRLLEGTPMWDKKVNVLQVTDSKENTMESRILVSARNSPTA